jgi:hypothetical protein
MQIENKTNPIPPMPLPNLGGRGAAAPAFSALLAPQDGATDRKQQTVEATAHQAARQLVSTTLVLPMLSQMGKDPFKTPLFHGGQAEETFNQQLNTILADRITAGANFPTVDVVYKQIMSRAKQVGSAKPQAAAGALNIHG